MEIEARCPFNEIELTRGMIAKVSPEDYDLVSGYKWHTAANGGGKIFYAARTKWFGDIKKNRTYYMHREIIKASPLDEVDHINGDGLDNRRENIRIAKHRENLQNQRLQTGRSSKYKGVYLDPGNNRTWIVQIRDRGTQRTIKGIENEDIAGFIYDLLALDRFKDFAKFNLPEAIEAWNRRAE